MEEYRSSWTWYPIAHLGNSGYGVARAPRRKQCGGFRNVILIRGIIINFCTS
jgi:hypothetical protein